jgi:hypothetical protein
MSRETALDFDGAALLVYLSSLQPIRVYCTDSQQPRFWFIISGSQQAELRAAYADEEQPILAAPLFRIQATLREYVRKAKRTGSYMPKQGE